MLEQLGSYSCTITKRFLITAGNRLGHLSEIPNVRPVDSRIDAKQFFASTKLVCQC